MKDTKLDCYNVDVDFGNTARDVLLNIDLQKEIANRKAMGKAIIDTSNMSYAASLEISQDIPSGIVHITLINKNGEPISEKELDLDTEHIIVSIRLDYENKKLIFTRTDGSEITCDISDLIDDLDAKIIAEAEARIEADNQLNTKLEEEAQTRFDRDEDLQNQLNDVNQALSDERQIRKEKDNELNAKLDSEISRSKEEDETLRNELMSEAERAIKAEEDLNNLINQEIERSKEVDDIHDQHLTELDNRVEQEIQDRTNADSELDAKIDAEIERAKKAEEELAEEISDKTLWEKGTGEHSIQVKDSQDFATGDYSSASGYGTQAEANYSHTEGFITKVSSDDEHDARYGHAEGYMTSATGLASHAEGDTTYTQNIAEHAQGRGNRSHKDSDAFGSAGNTIHSIGIASNNQDLTTNKNAVEIMQNGDQYIIGIGGYEGKDIENVKTVQEIINAKAEQSDLEAETQRAIVEENKKLNKENPGVFSAYVVDATGEQGTKEISASAKQYSIAYRGIDGKLIVGEPSANNHATTKQYVDTSITTLDTKLNQEINDRENADNILTTAIEGVASDLVTEVTAREALGTRVTTAEENITTLQGSAHIHLNKNELDLIESGDKEKWDTAVTDLADEIARATGVESTKVDKIDNYSLVSDEEITKLSTVSENANHVIVLASTPNGYVVIDGDNTLVYDDSELRGLIASKETGWVIDTQDEIIGDKDEDENYTNVTVLGNLDISLIKVGDNIYIKDKDVPDYWVSGKTEVEGIIKLSLNTLNTKIDLSIYFTKTEVLALLAEKANISDLANYVDTTTNYQEIPSVKYFTAGDVQVKGTNPHFTVYEENVGMATYYHDKIDVLGKGIFKFPIKQNDDNTFAMLDDIDKVLLGEKYAINKDSGDAQFTGILRGGSIIATEGNIESAKGMLGGVRVDTRNIDGCGAFHFYNYDAKACLDPYNYDKESENYKHGLYFIGNFTGKELGINQAEDDCWSLIQYTDFTDLSYVDLEDAHLRPYQVAIKAETGEQYERFGTVIAFSDRTTGSWGSWVKKANSKLLNNTFNGEGSFASGTSSQANGQYSSALGGWNIANGFCATALGQETWAVNARELVCGVCNDTSDSTTLFTVGNGTPGVSRSNAFTVHTNGKIKCRGSTEFGVEAHATGRVSQARGFEVTASGDFSHAEGYSVWTTNIAEHASGRGNVSHKASTTFGDAGNTLFSIGNGTITSRKNALEVFQDGHSVFQKQITITEGGLKIGNTTLTEEQLTKLLSLLDTMEVK